MSEAPGSTILTSAPAAPPAGAVGTPPPVQPAAAPNTPDNGIAAAQQAADRPEWVPEKYWDADKRAPKVEDMAKGYTNLEKLLGREKIPVPTDWEDQEQVDRWFKAAGMPDDEKGYDFNRPDKLPDGLGYDEDLEANFRKACKASGLNKKQAGNLYEQFVKHQVDRYGAFVTSQKQARAQVETDLRREHGGQFDGFVAGARAALAKYADPEYLRWLDESGQGNDPRVIRAWGRIGKEMSGETKLKGAPQMAASIQDAQRTISEFNGKYKDALWSKDHPDHELRVKERKALYEAAYGDQ